MAAPSNSAGAAAARPRELKFVLLGDSGVGKSSLVLRFVTQAFRPFSESTIGASFLSKSMEVDGCLVKFQIWDTAGQEKYHSLAPLYYRGCRAAIVVYDITRRESFATLQRWVKELQEKTKDIQILVAGNKKDLEDKRQVETFEAQTYAENIGALFMEVSAKEDVLVTEMFVELSRRVPEPMDNSAAGRGGGIYLASSQPRAKDRLGGTCC